LFNVSYGSELVELDISDASFSGAEYHVTMLGGHVVVAYK